MVNAETTKICRLCKREFKKSEVGRIKILRREKKGESVLWICSQCAGRIKFVER